MKKNFLFPILFLFFCIVLEAQQSSLITTKYFPEPLIEFSTPTLSIKEDRFATYEEIRTWIERNISKEKNASVKIIGTTPGGREVPVIYLSNGTSVPKIRVWMQGLLHGNEPAGGEALLFLAQEILNTEKGKNYLENMDIAILPIANIDGYLAMDRRSAGGYDLNRDQTKFADPVSKIIKKAFIDWNADIAIDFHEFQPTRKEYSKVGNKGATISYDVLFLPSGYLNVPAGLRRASEEIFQKEAVEALDAHGYTHNFYFTTEVSGNEVVLKKGAQSPHSSSTSFALANTVSMLVETRGIGLGRTSFKRRTYSAYLVAASFLESTLQHKEELHEIIEEARAETIFANKEIAVINEPAVYNAAVNFIDLETGDLVTLNLKTEDAENLSPKLTRSRPDAYILEPGSTREAEILSLLGLKIEQLKRKKKLKVESYVIRDYEESTPLWEGINKVKVTAETFSSIKVFPRGSYLVDLHQKNANYAISVLEPEAVNGFISYRVSKASHGDTLMVHRIIRK